MRKKTLTLTTFITALIICLTISSCQKNVTSTANSIIGKWTLLKRETKQTDTLTNIVYRDTSNYYVGSYVEFGVDSTFTWKVITSQWTRSGIYTYAGNDITLTTLSYVGPVPPTVEKVIELTSNSLKLYETSIVGTVFYEVWYTCSK